jgi:HSP20 family protein
MFVLPLARPVQRTSAPQFSRFIDRLFDESFDRAAAAPVASRTPALDVSETDAGYSVAFEVPGVTREQLKVTVEGRRVSIETVDAAAATPTADAAADQAQAATPRVLYRERSTARYARTVSLPAEVDQASSSAKFENGVLTLTLAKKVPTGALQISIS